MNKKINIYTKSGCLTLDTASTAEQEFIKTLIVAMNQFDRKIRNEQIKKGLKRKKPSK